VLGSLTTWAARSTALAALAASYSSTSSSGASANQRRSGAGGRPGAALGASALVRGQLASSRLLDELEAWLQQARREKQLTVLKQLLQVGQDATVVVGLTPQGCARELAAPGQAGEADHSC
jgi:hypothetical protein